MERVVVLNLPESITDRQIEAIIKLAAYAYSQRLLGVQTVDYKGTIINAKDAEVILKALKNAETK